MKQLIYFLVAVCFFCFSAFSNAQELTPSDIDQSVLYGAPQDPAYLEEDKTYMDQIIVNQDWAATTGCLEVRPDGRTWNGTEGGQCANSGTDKGTFTFGYGQTVLAQTQDAINDALKIAGISVVGYRWQWRVKNADTNYEDTNGARGQDPLLVRVIVKDSEGNVLDEREWDYSYHIDNWEQKYGMHWYDPFISGEDIDTITTEIEAYDAGYWAGWYGPEVGDVRIYSIFVYEAPETQDCSDPLLDPTCPGYAEALSAQQDEMLALINNSTITDTSTGSSDADFVAEVTVTVEESVMDSPIEEVIVESTSIEESPVLEEVADLSNPIEEPAEVIVEELESSEVEEASNTPSVNPLAVAQNAVSSALSEAESNNNATLEATSQSVAQAESIFTENEQQLQELSQQQSAETQQLSNDIQQVNTQQIANQLQIENEFSSTQIEASNQIAQSANIEQSQNNQQSNNTDQTGLDNTSMIGSAIDNMGSGDIMVSLLSTGNPQEINNMNQFDNMDSNAIVGDNQLVVEVTIDSFEIAALDMAIDEVFSKVLEKNLEVVEDSIEESNESIEEQNAKEDDLVEKALSGDDSEDAQAALLGYNPEFRAYQTPQMADGQFYQPKEIYGEQKNYDNPNQRLFNGASDTLHREMVRQQYNK